MFLMLHGKSVVVGRSTFYPKFVGETCQYVLFGSNLTNNIGHALG